MQVTLTWDLFIIVFFGIVIAYSFIVGKDESVKIIVSTYISILAVQALGTLLEQYAIPSTSLLKMLGLGMDVPMLSGFKVALFVALVILLAIKGGFAVDYDKESGSVLSTVFTGAFGVGTACLLLVALFTYVSGMPLLDPGIAASPLIAPIAEQSTLIDVILTYQAVWFALPAILLIVVGFMHMER